MVEGFFTPFDEYRHPRMIPTVRSRSLRATIPMRELEVARPPAELGSKKEGYLGSMAMGEMGVTKPAPFPKVALEGASDSDQCPTREPRGSPDPR
jgi:hypothetical protein